MQRKLEGMGASFSQLNIDEVSNFYKQPSPLDLFYQIAVKNIDLKELKDEFQVVGDKLVVPKPVKMVEPRNKAGNRIITGLGRKKKNELIIFGESSDKIVYTLANCCKPIPGDDVFGFVSTGKGLIIHRTNCPNAARLMSNFGHRVVKTKWAKNKEISFLTGVKILGLDDVGVYSQNNQPGFRRNENKYCGASRWKLKKAYSKEM